MIITSLLYIFLFFYISSLWGGLRAWPALHREHLSLHIGPNGSVCQKLLPADDPATSLVKVNEAHEDHSTHTKKTWGNVVRPGHGETTTWILNYPTHISAPFKYPFQGTSNISVIQLLSHPFTSLHVCPYPTNPCPFYMASDAWDSRVPIDSRVGLVDGELALLCVACTYKWY
jgi:hypothetical protein